MDEHTAPAVAVDAGSPAHDHSQSQSPPLLAASDDGIAGGRRYRAAPAKTFACRGFGECRMVFSRSEHLARHVRKHTGERPFPCHCGKQFSRLDNLRQHAQTVHADKVEQNERMMRELSALHTSMSASAKRQARAQKSPPQQAHPHAPHLHQQQQQQQQQAQQQQQQQAQYGLSLVGPGYGHVHSQSVGELVGMPPHAHPAMSRRAPRPGTSVGYDGFTEYPQQTQFASRGGWPVPLPVPMLQHPHAAGLSHPSLQQAHHHPHPQAPPFPSPGYTPSTADTPNSSHAGSFPFPDLGRGSPTGTASSSSTSNHAPSEPPPRTGSGGHPFLSYPHGSPPYPAQASPAPAQTVPLWQQQQQPPQQQQQQQQPQQPPPPQQAAPPHPAYVAHGQQPQPQAHAGEWGLGIHLGAGAHAGPGTDYAAWFAHAHATGHPSAYAPQAWYSEGQPQPQPPPAESPFSFNAPGLALAAGQDRPGTSSSRPASRRLSLLELCHEVDGSPPGTAGGGGRLRPSSKAGDGGAPRVFALASGGVEDGLRRHVAPLSG